MGGKRLAIALGISVAIHALALALGFIFTTSSVELPLRPTLRVSLVAPAPPVVISGQRGQQATQPVAAPRAGRNVNAKTATIPTRNGLLRSSSPDLLPKGSIDVLGRERTPPTLPIQAIDVHDGGGWKATVNREGRVAFKDKLPTPWSFDLTDLVMRIRGETLDRPKKQQFLDDTRELRTEMARDVNKENLAQSVIDLRARLTSVWDDQRLTLPEKKKQLFDMWDDCTEEGSEEVVNTSSLIRSMVISFIAHHFPHGSELAYSNAELAKFNSTRQSRSQFVPYSGG